uniref:Uncharacterized protein n=1 Tax=Panagrolaimus sp. ES5 TaxID=591445 RepID=A0AC34FLF1_9BILA
MATKGEFLYCKDTKKSFLGVASKDQYGSLNLNLTNHQAVIFKTLHSNSIDNKKFQNYDVLKDSRKVSTSWNNSSKQLTSTVLNLDRDSKEIGEFKKAKNINNSTLSLHIAAYENSITSDDSDGVERESLKAKDEKSGFAKKWETSNHLVNLSIIQNPFEFPRQQDDRAGYPDLMQFRASQRLLNPNQMDENNRRRHLPPS